MDNKLVIAISGQICRENSANLMNFWRGFINIQNSLYNVDDLKVIAHSWNPEHDSLIKNVYAVDKLFSEKQQNFFIEYVNNIQSLDTFEKGLNRANSKWKRVSYQSLLGNAKSRSRVMKLLNNDEFEGFKQVLATRWDQGCSGSRDVNIINYDQSLNSDYFYLSYFNEIDEGYADMWFLASLEDAKKFKNYDEYVLESLSGKNNYIENFTKNGWPLSLPRKKEKFRQEKFFLKVINGLEKVKLPFFNKKLNKYKIKLLTKIEMPIQTGENYSKLDIKSDVKFPVYQALNNHAILKSFILDKGLRKKTRFLETNDFQNNSEKFLINPISFAFVIYSHSSFSDCWEMAIGQALECLPETCKKIYLISDESEESYKSFKRIVKEKDNIEFITYSNDENYTKRLKKAYEIINREFEYAYFVHEDMPLVDSVDKVYLNALLHFLNNSNEFYIKLVDTKTVNKKEVHDSFPSLNRNYGECSMSVQASIFKLEYMITLFENLDLDIYAYELECTRSNLVFSSVAGDRVVGKSVIMNYKFPHITTAIAKGKWCTSEWRDEINYLANKYNIDLSVRGER